MSSLRQIDANRRNARLSTGPVTQHGKEKSRRNALRHGLTAETVIHALEDADDYAAFEMAVTADFDAQSAVERELVLRLASLLWRLRRVTAIEAGLFQEQVRQLLPIDQLRQSRSRSQNVTGGFRHDAGHENFSISESRSDHQFDGLTQAFVGLTNLPSYPLDRLCRYEASLWKQACQILFTLRCLDRRKPWQIWAGGRRR